MGGEEANFRYNYYVYYVGMGKCYMFDDGVLCQALLAQTSLPLRFPLGQHKCDFVM